MKRVIKSALAIIVIASFALAQLAETQHSWIVLRAKDASSSLQKLSPQTFGITERALKRRAKSLPLNRLMDELDLPVSETVIAQIRQTGVKIRIVSRWLNAVSVEATPLQLQLLNALPVVAALEPVAQFKRSRPLPSSVPLPSLTKTSSAQGLDYGQSATQLTNMKVVDLHAIGVNGTGVLIGMLDDGFNNYRIHNALKDIKVDSTYDFIHNISDVSRQPWENLIQGNHGAGTLSAVGGFEVGKMIGAAFGASFILAKTEMDSSGNSYDFNSEEDTYVAGLEWAERLGADITSSSLGYKEFWSSPTYTTSDLNGRTTKVAQAAAIASRKGVLVVTAMGNEGDMPMGLHRDSTLISPADADSIISVGATASDGELASFSGCGPTADGRIKPEVVAQGMAVYWADGSSTTSYNYVQGTSCSTPLVAGVAALVLSTHPELTPMQVREALLNTATPSAFRTSQNAVYPNNYYGWGFVDAYAAALYNGPVFSNNPQIVKTDAGFIVTTMIASKYKLYPDSIFYYYRYDDTSAYSRAQLFPTMNPNEYSTSIPPSPNSSFPSGYFVAHEEFGKPRYTPTSYVLMQNYPNPFNYGTTIKFELPIAAEVELAVFNLLGQRIKTIFQGKVKTVGINQWDGTNDHGCPVATGVYFARLKTLDKMFSIKMLLLK